MPRQIIRSATLVVVAGAVAVAPAIVRRHEPTDQQYRDLAAQFPAVGHVGPYPEQRTATLIAPGWILSAAHNGTSGVRFFQLGGQPPVEVVHWFSHPSFRSYDVAGGYDVSVGRLWPPITSVAPMAFFEGMNELGLHAIMVGAGSSGTGLTGAQSGTGSVMRAGENVVDINAGQASPGTPAWPNVLLSDFDNAAGTGNFLSVFGSSPTALPLEGNVAAGDSGGPLLIQQSGQWRIAGVISARGPAGSNSQYNTFSLFARMNTTASSPRTWAMGVVNTPGRLSGRIVMDRMVGPMWQTLLTIRIRDAGTMTVRQSTNLRTDNFDFVGLTTNLRGTFDIAVKSQNHLQVVLRNVTITDQGAVLPLINLASNGDANNDNQIGIDDFLILAGAYDSRPPSDPRADLNFDGACDIDDYLILASTYETWGTP